MDAVTVSDRDQRIVSRDQAIERAAEIIMKHAVEGRKLYLIGNGGSASIASHQAVDFWKNAKIPALAFNDASLLTCISNDFGYEHVFEKPVEMFADPGDVLIAISSSGQSENILRAVKMARSKKCQAITLSGFKPGNPLRSLGDVNFFVPSLDSYGFVEIAHLALCHCLVDTIIRRKLIKPVMSAPAS